MGWSKEKEVTEYEKNHSFGIHKGWRSNAASDRPEELSIDRTAATINDFISMLLKEGAHLHRGRREEQITFCLQDLSCFPPTWWWHHFPSPFSHRQSILWFAGRSWRLEERRGRKPGMNILEIKSFNCENWWVCDRRTIRKEGNFKPYIQYLDKSDVYVGIIGFLKS